jgi:hypothetical protein
MTIFDEHENHKIFTIFKSYFNKIKNKNTTSLSILFQYMIKNKDILLLYLPISLISEIFYYSFEYDDLILKNNILDNKKIGKTFRCYFHSIVKTYLSNITEFSLQTRFINLYFLAKECEQL